MTATWPGPGRPDWRAPGKHLGRVEAVLSGRGIAATVESRRGRASRELIEATRPGDTVVMASHGRGGPSRWFRGRVAEQVVRRSPVPVLLVRAQPVEAAAEGLAVA